MPISSNAPSKICLNISDYKRPVPNTDDFSLVWTREEFEKAIRSFKPCSRRDLAFWKEESGKIEECLTVDCIVDFQDNEKNITGVRANICLCGSKKFLTGRFRVPTGQPLPKFMPIEETSIQIRGVYRDLIHQTCGDMENCGTNQDFFLQCDQIAKLIAKTIGLIPDYPETSEAWSLPHGLLLVSGATKSAKSVYTRAILVYYLKHLLAQEKKNGKQRDFPHFVSFEDPREKWEIKTEGTVPSEIQEEWNEWKCFSPITAPFAGFNYTCREAGKDVDSLKAARLDAMRQTPKCFMIGELREEEDWKEAIELAGTGHLVVATTHAGSISECFSRMFSACKSHTEAKRGFIARRMLGVVHLRHEEIKNGSETKEGKFPRIWIKTPQSISALVAVGLSSLVPNGEFLLSRSHIIETYRKEVENDKCDPLRWKQGSTEESENNAQLSEWIEAAKEKVTLDDLLST